MNRREFMHCAAAVGLCPGWVALAHEESSSIRILPPAAGDLAGRESESGYALALSRLSANLPPRARIVIVPSASALKGGGLRSLLDATRCGSNILVDLSDGFASAADRTLTRENLRRYLRMEVSQPVTYATGDYIEFQWPRFALVRHFTRVSYIQPGKDHQPVAFLGAKPVVVRKEIGPVQLVILGSALGSLLLARDEQAHEIFAGILADVSARQS